MTTENQIPADYIAVEAFALAVDSGKSDDEAAQAAWMAVRHNHPDYRLARAPRWDEKFAITTTVRRAYTSPLGAVLWSEAPVYGQHSAKWPRTQQSYREAEAVRDAVIAELHRLSRMLRRLRAISPVDPA